MRRWSKASIFQSGQTLQSRLPLIPHQTCASHFLSVKGWWIRRVLSMDTYDPLGKIISTLSPPSGNSSPFIPVKVFHQSAS